MTKLFLSLLLTSTFLIGICEAVETKILVRAKSKDAKFIGSSMGGAHVTIRDSNTDAVLVNGMIEGGTGDTTRLMIEPQKRGAPLADASAAKFEATLDIHVPTLVTIEVKAPFGQRQSMVTNSTQIWLIPGKNVLGDGVIVEFTGMAVDVLSPQAPESIPLQNGRATIPIRANVVMMCGCPIEPGGLWDADDYEVGVLVRSANKTVRTLSLAYAGKSNTFEGQLEVTHGGLYELIIYAFQPSTGNSGVDRTTAVVK